MECLRKFVVYLLFSCIFLAIIKMNFLFVVENFQCGRASHLNFDWFNQIFDFTEYRKIIVQFVL